jgi:hypothetical protein
MRLSYCRNHLLYQRQIEFFVMLLIGFNGFQVLSLIRGGNGQL